MIVYLCMNQLIIQYICFVYIRIHDNHKILQRFVKRTKKNFAPCKILLYSSLY